MISSIRTWAFWAGIIGLVTAWGTLKAPWIGDGIRVNSIELVAQTAGFAGIGALLAYVRNHIWHR